MSGRGGRDRNRRDNPSRPEEKSHQGRSNAPPSRHLWVGNLSQNLAERDLAEYFLRFGELESVAFQPGRSYAFVNFRNDEAAFEAVRALQGFVVAGKALKIEFAKADKSSAPSRDEGYSQYRDEQRSAERGSPFMQRDSRTRRSPELSYQDKTRMADKNADPPSEVLWIGFPALLKVDEAILRRAFSPFGEIVKITVFPGRSYAFVRFKNIISACRAKETLQGKLFGNPRVHICFSKNESGSSNSGRDSFDGPTALRFNPYERAGSFENFREDRKYGSLGGEPPIRSPGFISDMDSLDPDAIALSRKRNLWSRMDGDFEQRRFQEPGHDMRIPENLFERHNSQGRGRGDHFRDFSPQQFSRNGPIYDDSWEFPEDASLHHGPKKLKVGAYLPEDELPEYPLSGSGQAKHVFQREFPDRPQREAIDRNFESGHFGYEHVPDRPMKLPQQYDERRDHHLDVPYDNFPAGSGSLPPHEWRRSTPESQQPSLTKEWKWEGTIAKGGTPVCRARCFPVGKVLDIPLPEFLDCTARTSLDMLAKHYYQAASAWVIFFVPGSDADIGFYNEFLHYLGEKERAAVAKLDEKTTLFLVPPSEFSEKVLKVPGKLSISGVILRLDNPNSNLGSSFQHHHQQQDNKKDSSFMSYHGDMASPIPSSNTVSFPSSAHSLPKTGSNLSFSGSGHGMGTTASKAQPNWSSPHQQQEPNPRQVAASQPSNSSFDPPVQGYNPALSSSGNFSSQVNRQQQVGSSASAAPDLQGEQLASLASSFLGHANSIVNPSHQNPSHLESSTSQYASQMHLQQNQTQQVQLQQQLMQQLQQQQGSQQPPSGGSQEEDADPQRRLQATLQLAAALLQQIQQGKGT